ncbi:hypothetical protein V8B97DRAFT_1031605 [Scleroderma yunnanense]
MPTSVERTRFKNEITEMFHGAIHVGLSTIPLYPIYSIKGVRTDLTIPLGSIDGPRAKTKIAVVVRQEMLHLALAGNILTTIDSDFRIYIKSDIPTYGLDETILHSLAHFTCHSSSNYFLEEDKAFKRNGRIIRTFILSLSAINTHHCGPFTGQPRV